MASSSGTTTNSGSSGGALQNSGSSEEDLQILMDQRKRKRMISNRESARRSRMRKQQHLEDLMNQLAQLRKENSQIITTVNVTTQHFMNIEAENSILRTQLAELTHRLQSLNEIIEFLNVSNGGGMCNREEPSSGYLFPEPLLHQNDPFISNSWNNNIHANQIHPLMASSADMLLY